MFTPTSLLNYTANTKHFTQPLVNKGNDADHPVGAITG